MLPEPHRTVRYDLAWRRRHVAAMIALCVLAAVLTAAGAGGRTFVPEELSVDPAKVAAAQEKINPNVATPASLTRLPGIGPVRAAAIIQTRARRPFRTAADLDDVPGIGKTTIEHLSPYLAPELTAQAHPAK